MSPVDRLAAELYREEVRRARSMPPEDKLLEGPRLFARACRVMADGIRYTHPELDNDQVTTRLTKRLDRLRAIESL